MVDIIATTDIYNVNHRGCHEIDAYTVTLEEYCDTCQRFLSLDRYYPHNSAKQCTVVEEIEERPIFGERSISRIETTYNLFIGTKKNCEDFVNYLCSLDFTIEKRGTNWSE